MQLFTQCSMAQSGSYTCSNVANGGRRRGADSRTVISTRHRDVEKSWALLNGQRHAVGVDELGIVARAHARSGPLPLRHCILGAASWCRHRQHAPAEPADSARRRRRLHPGSRRRSSSTPVRARLILYRSICKGTRARRAGFHHKQSTAW